MKNTFGRFNIFLIIIKFYQFFISPLLGSNCRFYPTCSEYAKQAIMVHGTIKGLYLFFKRFCKCQPFGSQGFDAVPIKQNKKELGSKN